MEISLTEIYIYIWISFHVKRHPFCPQLDEWKSHSQVTADAWRGSKSLGQSFVHWMRAFQRLQGCVQIFYYWYSGTSKKNYLTCSLCHQSMHTVGVREPGAKIMQNHVRCFLLPRSELCKIRQSNNKQEPFLDGRIATRHSALIEIFFFTFKCFVISYGNYNNIPS
jgi:hypothetical protein